MNPQTVFSRFHRILFRMMIFVDVVEYHVINSVPKFPSMYWVSNIYPTFRTGATNRCIDPTVESWCRSCWDFPPRTVHRNWRWQEFNGSLETQQLVDLEGSWMEGSETENDMHVEHFEYYVENISWLGTQWCLGYTFSTCRTFSKIGTWSVLHTAYNVARLHPKKGHLATPRNSWPSAVMSTWSYANPLGPRVTIFPIKQTRFALVTSFISGSEMRLAQMGCGSGFDKKSKAPSSRNELWKCAGEIHMFVKVLGPKFGLMLLTLKLRFIFYDYVRINVSFMAWYVSMRTCSAVRGIPYKRCVYIFCKMTQSLGLYYAVKWGLR